MTPNAELAPLPDMKVSVRQVFGIDSDLEVPAYSEPESHVPDTDADYVFDRDTTLVVGFQTRIGRGLIPAVTTRMGELLPDWRLTFRQVPWRDSSAGLGRKTTPLPSSLTSSRRSQPSGIRSEQP